MRLVIACLIFVPLAIFFGIFAIENRMPLTLKLWPLSGYYEVWMSVCIFGVLVAGMLFGLVVGWLSGSDCRRRAFSAERRLRNLEEQQKKNYTSNIV